MLTSKDLLWLRRLLRSPHAILALPMARMLAGNLPDGN